MHANTLFSTILCFQTLFCTIPSLCGHGSADEVLAKLRANFSDTETLHLQAQICFDTAVGAKNMAVIKILPKHYPIRPISLMRRHAYITDAVIILLTSDWLYKGEILSGQELFTSHLNDIPDPEFLQAVLYAAAKLGYLGVIKGLVAGKQLDPSSGKFDSALHLAAQQGHFEIVRYILDFNINKMDWLGNIFIHACLRSVRSIEFVKILCEEYGVDPKAYHELAVTRAAASGNVDLMNYLALKGLDVSVNIGLSLDYACGYGHIEMVKYLLNFPGVKASHVDYILGKPYPAGAKLILLNWIAYNMTEVNMIWVPIYKEQMLAHPEFAAQYQAVKDGKVFELRANGFQHIAKFVEDWAEALTRLAISGRPVLADLADSYLSVLLTS